MTHIVRVNNSKSLVNFENIPYPSFPVNDRNTARHFKHCPSPIPCTWNINTTTHIAIPKYILQIQLHIEPARPFTSIFVQVKFRS